jgi:glycosyltransferase involved in cell wall biosynthesis
LIGGGVDAARIADRIRSEHVTNVSYLGVLERNAALCHMREADVTIAPLLSNLTDAIPSKIFDSLGVGCPVVVCARGEAASLVCEARGGMAVPPEDPLALADALFRLATDRPRLREAGARGYAFVRDRYSRAHTTELFVTLLERLRCA